VRVEDEFATFARTTGRAKCSSPLKNFVNNCNNYRELLHKILHIIVNFT